MTDFPNKEKIHENPKFEIIRQVVTGCHVGAIAWFLVAYFLQNEWLLIPTFLLVIVSGVMAVYSYSLEGYEEWLKERTGNTD